MDNEDQKPTTSKPAIVRAQKEAFGFLRRTVTELFEGSVGEAEITMDMLDQPPDRRLGDLCLPCFFLAKPLGRSPADVAAELAEKFEPTPLVASAEAAGPYVNFKFDRDSFSRAVLEDVFGKSSGYWSHPFNLGVEPQNLLVEYGQPNTHKEVHVGHLRNFFLGLCFVRLQESVGHRVTPVSYIGDVGAHVAKCLWAYKKLHDGETPEPGQEGKFLGGIYTEASQLIEEDESLKDEVSTVQQALESGDPAWTELWQETRQWSLDEMQHIFEEVGCDFSRTYYESEVEEPGKKLVRQMLADGLAQESQGAIIMNLEDEDLGIFLLLKSDGNSLYATKDLALAQLKFSEYKDTDVSINIVDNRQSLYFKQLFVALKRMKFDEPMFHLAYDFVTLKGGAMSSRKGNVITYTEFRDKMLKLAEAETRNRHADWEGERVHDVAWTMVEGAMKFTMLRQDAERPIVFDLQEALSFDGFTGPYVQYSHARLCSIQAKDGGSKVTEIPEKASFTEEEYAVLRQVAELPLAVAVAASGGAGQFNPSFLAQYAFDLAQRSNDFYRDVPVLSVDGDDRLRRLAIVEAVRQTIERSLQLLGIASPTEM